MISRIAVDLGASSGRIILGRLTEGCWSLEEVHRFPNGPAEAPDGMVWDLEGIYSEMLKGIRECFRREPRIESLAIDSWGVDYVLEREDGAFLPCRSYRDPRTEEDVEFAKKKVPPSYLYGRTGTQFQPFNTIYQLLRDKREGALEGCRGFLMVPEYLAYRLTGRRAHEYTNASTTGLLDASRKEYDFGIIRALGLPSRIFPETLGNPGDFVGTLLPEVATEVGGDLAVRLCASHDTASAVEGMELDEDSIFLSSGTWSLIGTKRPRPVLNEEARARNFTNEGGPGYIRFLKNIMGLWIVQRLRAEICPGKDFGTIAEEASRSKATFVPPVDDPSFLSPRSMKEALLRSVRMEELSESDLFESVFRGLAFSYAKAVREIETLTGKTYKKIVIAGGGAKNSYLNELTRKATGKEAVALPIEASALGNLITQGKENS